MDLRWKMRKKKTTGLHIHIPGWSNNYNKINQGQFWWRGWIKGLIINGDQRRVEKRTEVEKKQQVGQEKPTSTKKREKEFIAGWSESCHQLPVEPGERQKLDWVGTAVKVLHLVTDWVDIVLITLKDSYSVLFNQL